MEQITNLNSRVGSTPVDSDSFVALPRNCDTAVVYWNIENETRSTNDSAETRLCLQISGNNSNAEESIFLHRDSGHFIVPLLADERSYEINLGWSDNSGFHAISSQEVRLPDHPVKENLGAMSSSLSYRGAHFWPKGCDTSVN